MEQLAHACQKCLALLVHIWHILHHPKNVIDGSHDLDCLFRNAQLNAMFTSLGLF